MITNKDIKILFKWAENNFSANHTLLGSSGYWNKTVLMTQIKSSKGHIRKSKVSAEIFDILSNPEIITSFFVLVEPNSISLPHIDPPIYKEKTKRIQIPLEVPKGKKTFMIYENKKFYWEKGIPQVFDVMSNVHEAQNLTVFPLKFLMLDVKFDTNVDF